jgi:hypothetical protein
MVSPSPSATRPIVANVSRLDAAVARVRKSCGVDERETDNAGRQDQQRTQVGIVSKAFHSQSRVPDVCNANHPEHDEAGNQVLPFRAQALQHQHDLDHADDERAGERAEHRALRRP